MDVGHLIIAGFRGTSPSDPDVDQLRRYLGRGEVSGVMLLERNISSPSQLERLITALKDATPDLPPIICVDQEGGEVTRLGASNGFMPWMSAASLAASGRKDADIFEYYLERAGELAAVGINLNLGPVVDLNVNPFNPIIGMKGRSYGRSVNQVVRFAELFIKAHRSVGVKTCLKHFPGHGSSNADSHKGSADVSQTWSSEEIAPFERLVRAGLADTIMNSHVIHKYLSDEPWVPTSLSWKSTRELREGLAFKGPVITDDMQMRAITDVLPAADAGVAAIKAGNSMLIYSNYERRYSIQSVSDVNRALRMALDEGVLSPKAIAEQVSAVVPHSVV